MVAARLSDDTLASLERSFRMLIGCEWVEAASGDQIGSIDPASGRQVALIPAAGTEDIDRAVAAARQAFDSGTWRSLAPGRRAEVLRRAADLLLERATEFAELETLDNGKPIAASAVMDIPAAVASLRYWSGWCTRLGGTVPTVDLPGDFLAVTVPEPAGVVAIITPWNFPLVQAVVKIAPALAAGCTCVVKPAELTSLTLLRFGEVLLDAGVPPGAVNIVSGLGATAGEALAGNCDIDKISFTGSTATGKHLVRTAGGNLKRLTLELGGKSPVILMDDADLERALPSVAGGIFRNAGQMCAAGSRLLVARPLLDTVVDALVARAGDFRMGPGLDPQTVLGPLVSADHRERVHGCVKQAAGQGLDIRTGGRVPDEPGYFYPPTIVIDPTGAATISHEEVFGPVLTVTPFDDTGELADLANSTTYGLSANIWTADIASAQRLARKIRAGTVTINSGMVVGPDIPFGGFKQSGWGREGGRPGIEAFLESKTIITAL